MWPCFGVLALPTVLIASPHTGQWPIPRGRFIFPPRKFFRTHPTLSTLSLSEHLNESESTPVPFALSLPPPSGASVPSRKKVPVLQVHLDPRSSVGRSHVANCTLSARRPVDRTPDPSETSPDWRCMASATLSTVENGRSSEFCDPMIPTVHRAFLNCVLKST